MTTMHELVQIGSLPFWDEEHPYGELLWTEWWYDLYEQYGLDPCVSWQLESGEVRVDLLMQVWGAYCDLSQRPAKRRGKRTKIIREAKEPHDQGALL